MAAFWVFHFFSSRTMEQDARANAQNTLKIINLQIEKVLRQVEAVPDNLNWIVTNGHFIPDSLYGVTRSVVLNNPHIYGSAIAFEPHYFPQKGYYFSPYSYRDGEMIRSLQLGNNDYDYFNWEWYSEPKRLSRPCWSEPYYDEGGGQMVMCTYSAPIFDKSGAMIGVFTSDISLEWLTDLVDNMKRSNQAYAFIIGRDGTYIAHYLRERILNATIFEVSEEMANDQVSKIGKEMIAGNQGMQLLDNDGVRSYVFYAPVPSTQWSLGIVLPGDEVFEELRRLNLIMYLIVGLGLICLFVICFRIVNKLTRPLQRFAATARTIAHGHFDVRLPDIRSKDEMRELFDSFSYMQAELNNYIVNLKRTTSAKEKIESELRIARNIQMSMLPKVFPPFPNHNPFDLFAALNPAKEVGGDLYDFFIKGERLYFAIGDVSGKGVPASLLMAVTLTLFRSVSERMDNPVNIIHALNAAISENNSSNMFVTMFLGILDLNTGQLAYCNAGHDPLILVGPDGACKWMEVVPNLPLGVIKGFAFKEQHLTLPTKSSLILYTDGVTEAENAQQELYGKERLLNIIRKNPHLSPRAMIGTLLSDIDDYVKMNEPSDDIAVMVIHYHQTCTTTLIISNQIEELTKVSEWISRIGGQMSLAPDLVMNLNIAIEEAVANVIQYGNALQVELSFSTQENKLTFTLTDTGVAFDPTLQETPNVALSAEERPIGGLGIFLIKQLMDEVIYKRENEKNTLIMSKTINQ